MLREAAALRQVEFRFDSVSNAQVARIPLDRLRSYQDLSALELAGLGVALASKDVPFEVIVHLEARNPEANDVTARLVAMDWTYLVDDREILSGRLDRPMTFPPGEGVDVPVAVSFDLVRFFGGDAKELFDTALALAGWRTGQKIVSMRFTPTIESPAGPIRYPVPITVTMPPRSGG